MYAISRFFYILLDNAVLTTPYVLPYGFPHIAPAISPYNISPVPLGVPQKLKTPDPYQGLHIKSDPGQNEPELWTPAVKYYDILGLSKLFSKPATPQKSFTKPNVRAQVSIYIFLSCLFTKLLCLFIYLFVYFFHPDRNDSMLFSWWRCSKIPFAIHTQVGIH